MADIIIYNTKDGKAAIKLYAENGTVWLTQAQIAELFNKNISTISRHIANIFDENEVEEKSNLRFMQIANSDKPVAYYSLEVILAIGFRVRSPRGTQFRQWNCGTKRKAQRNKTASVADGCKKNITLDVFWKKVPFLLKTLP